MTVSRMTILLALLVLTNILGPSIALRMENDKFTGSDKMPMGPLVEEEDACLQPMAQRGHPGGPICLAWIPSWTFNKMEKKCEEFIYGGE